MSSSLRNRNPRRRPRTVNLRRRRQIVMLSLAVLALFVAAAVAWYRRTEQRVVEGPTATPTTNVRPTPTDRPPLANTATSALDGTTTAETAATPGSTDDFFNPQRFSYEPDFYQPQMQAFLERQPGPLKSVRFQIGDRAHSFSDVLVSFSSLLSLNPKLFLALIESQSGLLSAAQPSDEQFAWAVGFQGDGGQRRGLASQLRWAGRELRWAVRDYAGQRVKALPDLIFNDGTRQAPPAGISLTRYALSRVLAPSTTPDQLPAKLAAFQQTYIRLFEDPRPPPRGWPVPAAPFLAYPLAERTRVTSFFDHDAPFLQPNGSLLTYWGRAETDIAFAYDGHTGWDYAAKPPDTVLAAADGRVVFAGNSDDGCGVPARAVIIDHGNGYRTLYWHLNALEVETGQQITRGAPIGVAGSTGCVTGPHLHFQVQFLGRDVDPYGWCGKEPDPWMNSPAGQISVWLWADAPSPCGSPPADMIVVDDSDPGFSMQGAWQQNSVGYGGGSLYAAAIPGARADEPWQIRALDTPALAVWRPTLPRAGRYRVIAYIPYALSGLLDSVEARYLVRYRGGEAEVKVDTELERNGWADLGTYEFDPADKPLVSLSTLAGDENTSVWADAVVWIPVGD